MGKVWKNYVYAAWLREVCVYVLENHKHLIEEEIIYSNKKDAGRTVWRNGFWRENLVYILGGNWVVVNDICSVDRVIWRWHWVGSCDLKRNAETYFPNTFKRTMGDKVRGERFDVMLDTCPLKPLTFHTVVVCTISITFDSILKCFNPRYIKIAWSLLPFGIPFGEN